MPRRLRQETEGAVHHVYARGNDRRRIFLDDIDRCAYLRRLGETTVRMGWRCLSYCLMDNHVHLLIETPEPNLAAGMQRLHGGYAQLFNERHGRSGHVFQGRYGAVRIEDEAQLWTTVRYIAQNPLEAGLVSAVDSWEWSSHAAVVSGSGPAWLDVERLLGHFDGAGGQPMARYRALIG
jgi:REP element-mobilizing transposase RayT